MALAVRKSVLENGGMLELIALWKNTLPPDVRGRVVSYLPEICSAVLLLLVCLFSILEKVSD